MSSNNQAALTIPELLVSILVAIVVVFLVTFLGGTTAPVKAQQTQTLSNMWKLQLATQAMAKDGQITGMTNLAWPGDTGGSFATWASNLVRGDYLKSNDFNKLLSAPGRVIPPGPLPPSNDNAVLVYAVSSNSPSNAILLTTANFTNTPQGGRPLLKEAKPYGDNGFVVFRKGGDGAVYRATQVGDTNTIGSFVPLCK